jgi:putative endonuclease
VSGAVEGPPHFAFVVAVAFAFPLSSSNMIEQAYVYILASSFQKLYIGVTTEIEVRVRQHKNGAYAHSFTSRFKIDKLVYLERFAMVSEAIAREKQLKKWSRIKKLRIIVAQNPTWRDLSAAWDKPIQLYTGN